MRAIASGPEFLAITGPYTIVIYAMLPNRERKNPFGFWWGQIVRFVCLPESSGSIEDITSNLSEYKFGKLRNSRNFNIVFVLSIHINMGLLRACKQVSIDRGWWRQGIRLCIFSSHPKQLFLNSSADKGSKWYIYVIAKIISFVLSMSRLNGILVRGNSRNTTRCVTPLITGLDSRLGTFFQTSWQVHLHIIRLSTSQ